MTQEIEQILKNIQEKLVDLSKKNAVLRKENQSLKEALIEAKQIAENATGNAEMLQHQLDARKYSKDMMNAEEKKAFEKKMGDYVKEIDRCIALLSV